MTARPIPKRHWRSYGDDPLATGRDALDEPLAAFPSWFMRITCDRCGKDRMLNEVHARSASAPCRSATSSTACATTAAAKGQGGWSCSPASRPPAAGRCDGSCCGRSNRRGSIQINRTYPDRSVHEQKADIEIGVDDGLVQVRPERKGR